MLTGGRDLVAALHPATGSQAEILAATSSATTLDAYAFLKVTGSSHRLHGALRKCQCGDYHTYPQRCCMYARQVIKPVTKRTQDTTDGWTKLSSWSCQVQWGGSVKLALVSKVLPPRRNVEATKSRPDFCQIYALTQQQFHRPVRKLTTDQYSLLRSFFIVHHAKLLSYSLPIRPHAAHGTSRNDSRYLFQRPRSDMMPEAYGLRQPLTVAGQKAIISIPIGQCALYVRRTAIHCALSHIYLRSHSLLLCFASLLCSARLQPTD